MTRSELRQSLALLPPDAVLSLTCGVLLAVLDEAPETPAQPPVARDSDTWLTAAETGARLGVSARWCYDHAAQLGVRKLSHKCVRFSARAVDRYMTRRRGWAFNLISAKTRDLVGTAYARATNNDGYEALLINEQQRAAAKEGLRRAREIVHQVVGWTAADYERAGAEAARRAQLVMNSAAHEYVA